MNNLFASIVGGDLDSILDKMGDAVCLADKDFVFLAVNANFARFYGLSDPQQLLGKSAYDVYPGFKKSVFYEACMRTAATGETTTRYGYSMGQKKWFVARCYQVGDNLFAMMVHDITDNTNKAGYVSQVDALTSLPNRWAFENDSHQLHNLKDFAAVLVDISHFRDFNDKVGFAAEDRCLMEIGARTRQHTCKSDRVYRLGNDQFLILGSNAPEDIDYRRHNLLPLLVEPLLINGQEYELQFNIAMVLCTEQSQAETLLTQAENALLVAKKHKQPYVVYSDAMHDTSVYDPSMIKTIRDAIANDQFVAYFQPQIDLIDNKTCSAEALIRWNKNGTVVSPAHFLPFAEESGLILELDQVVARKTFEQLAAMEQKNLFLPISLNLSAHSLCTNDTVEFFKALLKEIPVQPHLVGIEITETSFMRNLEVSQIVIEELKQLGFHISIDDFGTGYSSMSYLLRYPSNFLKIDREFVMHIGKEKAHQVIVKNIIGLAHGMHIGVVAEGIESQEDLDLLKNLGCDIGQGYFIAKPLSPADFNTWLDTQPLTDFGGDLL